jgi:hypothetical protein
MQVYLLYALNEVPAFVLLTLPVFREACISLAAPFSISCTSTYYGKLDKLNKAIISATCFSFISEDGRNMFFSSYQSSHFDAHFRKCNFKTKLCRSATKPEKAKKQKSMRAINKYVNGSREYQIIPDIPMFVLHAGKLAT